MKFKIKNLIALLLLMLVSVNIVTAQSIKLLGPVTSAGSKKLIFKNNFKAYDYITTRAVAPMDVVLKYALPILKSGGYFVAYKSKKALDELKEAEKTFKVFGAKLHNIIEYQLPLEEVYERNLIIVRKK